MADAPDKSDENFEEGFDEGFGFDEEPRDPIVPPPQTPKGPPPGGKLFIIAVLSVLVGGLYMGYNFFSKYASKNVELEASAAKVETSIPAISESEFGGEVPPSLAKEKGTSPVKSVPGAPATPTTPSPFAAIPPMSPAIPASPAAKATDQKVADQKAATADQKTAATDQKAGALAQKPETLTEEDTIQSMQKDLFAPEAVKTPATPPTAKAESKQTPPKEASVTAHIPPAELAKLTVALQTLQKLNEQMEKNLLQIKSLEAYTREVSQTLQKMNVEISALDNRLLALTNTTTSLTKDVGNFKSDLGSVRREVGKVKTILGEDILDESPVAITPVKYRSEATVIVEEPEYVVHAVIPGRAWLKSVKGQILTVTEGDAIGNYGKIIVIDATNGVVLTSSGVTFR